MMEVAAADLETLAEVLKSLNGVLELNKSEEMITLVHYAGELTPQQVNKHCFDNGIVLNRLGVKNKNLESKFLELTK
jgi:ABC-2 type transport system ATP-binding protein